MSEIYWIGGAARTAQVDTITVANTWANGDTVTITIGGEDLVVTIGDDVTTSNVATAIKDAIVATSALDGTGTTDATSNRGGQEIREFTEVTATVSTNVVSVTTTSTVNTNFPGKPFTMSVTEVTAGTGTASEATATAASGPHDASVADNWSGGAVPVNSDDVIFDNRGLFDCLYGLDLSSVALTSLKVTNGFRKKIGLSTVNSDSASNVYPEYRDTYLQVQSAALTIYGEGAGSERINIDLGSATACTMNISANGRQTQTQGADAYIPPVLLLGTNASNILRVTKGNVGVAFYNGESAHLATLAVGPDQQTIVQCGDGVDLANATITVSGGSLTYDGATGSGTVSLTGGTTTILSGAQAAITAQDAIVNYNGSGTITALTLRHGGQIFFSPDLTRTVTSTTLYAGATYSDPAWTVTPTGGWDFSGCGPGDLEVFDPGKHLTLTPTTI